MSAMSAVLGIDAAWTNTEPSGVALIERWQGRWVCVQSSSSYAAFIDPKNGAVGGAAMDVAALLERCGGLLGGRRPGVVAVDMPIGRRQITERRPADQTVSKAFGHARCAVHSPTVVRPGAVGARFVEAFKQAGYELRFETNAGSERPALIEVYPHVALLDLMESKERVPYKCGKTGAYWKGLSLDTRREKLLKQWRSVELKLRNHIDNIDLGLPPLGYYGPLSHLKAYEDRLDALICAWVGALYVEGKAQPLGDTGSAIWVPSAAMKYAKQP